MVPLVALINVRVQTLEATSPGSLLSRLATRTLVFLGLLPSWIWCPEFSSWLLLLVNTLCSSCPGPKIRCKMIPDTRFFLPLLFLHWLHLCQILFYTVQRTVAFVGARHSCSLARSILINPFKKIPRLQTDTKYRKELRRQREAFRKRLGMKEFLIFLSAGIVSLYCLYAIACFKPF